MRTLQPKKNYTEDLHSVFYYLSSDDEKTVNYYLNHIQAEHRERNMSPKTKRLVADLFYDKPRKRLSDRNRVNFSPAGDLELRSSSSTVNGTR